MNRISFIKHIGMVPLLVAFNPMATASSRFFENLTLQYAASNRILVLIQLNGGNDGLNTIIPVKDYDVLTRLRKNILIPEHKILKLNDTNDFGFHPSLSGLQNLYNNKLLSVVHGVGYPNPEFSHSKGTSIKLTANFNPGSSNSGWAGRYLEQIYPKFDKGPNPAEANGPPGMRIGEVSPMILQGTDVDYGISIRSISDLDFNNPDVSKDPTSNNTGGRTISLIRDIAKRIEFFAPIIKSANSRQPNLSKLYPDDNKNMLAEQLKIVARLIGGNLNSRIYVVNQNGYDTHANQVDKADTTIGSHADLLHDLSEAITAFEDDIHLMGKQDEVLGMTFSEFGRRVKSSDSYGTDHGTAEAVILFGTKLKSRMIMGPGASPLKASDENLLMQIDFRSLYASVLNGWLGMTEDKIKQIIQQAPLERLNLFNI